MSGCIIILFMRRELPSLIPRRRDRQNGGDGSINEFEETIMHSGPRRAV
jgi:hypothetical protein